MKIEYWINVGCVHYAVGPSIKDLEKALQHVYDYYQRLNRQMPEVSLEAANV